MLLDDSKEVSGFSTMTSESRTGTPEILMTPALVIEPAVFSSLDPTQSQLTRVDSVKIGLMKYTKGKGLRVISFGMVMSFINPQRR
jgi:hypothetical protein